jgi:kinesin family protein C2/C3
MEDCCDPLLATDASPRPESFSRSEKDIASRSRTVAMADLDSNCELSNGKSFIHFKKSS